jgi:hypothetical protein
MCTKETLNSSTIDGFAFLVDKIPGQLDRVQSVLANLLQSKACITKKPDLLDVSLQNETARAGT